MNTKIALSSFFLFVIVVLNTRGQHVSQIETTNLEVITAGNVHKVEQITTIELDSYAHNLSWSADNVRLASSVGNKVIIYNVHSGDITEIDHLAYGLFFVPHDPDFLVIVSRTIEASFANVLVLMDLRTNLNTMIELPFIYAATFSPDGSLFAVSHAVDLNERIVLFETKSWTQVGLLELESDYSATELTFSPDQSWLATINSGGGGYLWDVQEALKNQTVSFEEALRLGNFQRSEAVAFSDDGILAIASDNFRLSPEQAANPQLELSRISERNGKANVSSVFSIDQAAIDQRKLSIIHDLTFTPNGELLLAVTENGQLQFWNAISGDLDFTLSREKTPILNIAVNQAGTLIATVQDNQITLWGITG